MRVKIAGTQSLDEIPEKIVQILEIFKTYKIGKARGINLYLNLIDENGDEIEDLLNANGEPFNEITVKDPPKQKAKQTIAKDNIIPFPAEAPNVKTNRKKPKEPGIPLQILETSSG